MKECIVKKSMGDLFIKRINALIDKRVANMEARITELEATAAELKAKVEALETSSVTEV